MQTLIFFIFNDFTHTHIFPLLQVVPSDPNGELSVKQKAACEELELEGWRVVRPDPLVWKSLALSEKSSKRSYLKALLAGDKENDPSVVSSQRL